MNRPWVDRLALAALGSMVLAVALATRPLLPVDETRYVSVAWEMWTRGAFLVPWLNGAPYAHKPPLLFWLIQAGWALFGVNAWWPRLVAPLAGLACLVLTARLAQALWPEVPAVRREAPWLLFGTLFFAVFATFVQFDLLLTACVLLGLLGLVRAARGARGGFALLALGLGLGGLAKGPVVLLHVLPAGLLAAGWTAAGRRWRWYAGLVAAVAGGAALALAWAIPAAQAGGPAYREAIFWGQTAGRVVQSFAHRQPWWWYLPRLPLLVLPWLLWRALWSRPVPATGGPVAPYRFLAAWLVPVLVGFSLVSGKQLKYLLPLLPGAALWGSAVLAGARRPVGARGALVLTLALGGGLLGLLPAYGAHRQVALLAALPAWPGALLAAAALGVGLAWRPAQPAAAVRGLALGTALLVVVAHLGPVRRLAPAYDLEGFARALGRAQAAGATLAHVGKYHGQFHFLGRLRRPLVVLSARQAAAWARRHPRALVVAYRKRFSPPLPVEGALRVQDYRGEAAGLMLWRAADLAAVLAQRREG